MSDTLQLFSWSDYNSVQIAAAQASADTPINFSEGSNDLAIVEASSGTCLFLQAQIVTVLSITRAKTSSGVDLDSFYADFNFPRLAGTYSTGVVSFIRSNTSTVVTIPCNGTANVLLSDGSQTYTVVADVNQPTYNATSNTYIVPTGAASASITCQAVTLGTAANIPVGTGLIIGSNIAGIDSAITISGFSNGIAAESDDNYRSRFPPYLAGLARGTATSIQSAILNVQQGIQFQLQDNQDTQGNFEPGNFIVTIDDGSGSPPASLITAVDAAVSAYQAETISHNVRGPTVIEVVIAAETTITTSTGLTAATINSQTTNAVMTYVNSQLLGATPFSYSVLIAKILASSTAVTNVQNVTINGATSDITVAPNQVVKLLLNNFTLTNT